MLRRAGIKSLNTGAMPQKISGVWGLAPNYQISFRKI